MRTFTLDTNCLIAIDEGRSEATAVHALAAAHAANTAHVAVVAISASERQRGAGYIQSFTEFRARLSGLGLGHLDILKPMAYFDITFLDWCIWSGPDLIALERQIHDTLFPNVEFIWQDYCRAKSLDPTTSLSTSRWRNCKCDVQAIWSHIQNKRDVFVTSDPNFHGADKKAALIVLGAKQIERPEDAALLI